MMQAYHCMICQWRRQIYFQSQGERRGNKIHVCGEYNAKMADFYHVFLVDPCGLQDKYDKLDCHAVVMTAKAPNNWNIGAEEETDFN